MHDSPKDSNRSDERLRRMTSSQLLAELTRLDDVLATQFRDRNWVILIALINRVMKSDVLCDLARRSGDEFNLGFVSLALLAARADFSPGELSRLSRSVHLVRHLSRRRAATFLGEVKKIKSNSVQDCVEDFFEALTRVCEIMKLHLSKDEDSSGS